MGGALGVWEAVTTAVILVCVCIFYQVTVGRPIPELDGARSMAVGCRGGMRSRVGPRADAGAFKGREDGVDGAEFERESERVTWVNVCVTSEIETFFGSNSHRGWVCRSGLLFLLLPIFSCSFGCRGQTVDLFFTMLIFEQVSGDTGSFVFLFVILTWAHSKVVYIPTAPLPLTI